MGKFKYDIYIDEIHHMTHKNKVQLTIQAKEWRKIQALCNEFNNQISPNTLLLLLKRQLDMGPCLILEDETGGINSCPDSKHGDKCTQCIKDYIRNIKEDS